MRLLYAAGFLVLLSAPALPTGAAPAKSPAAPRFSSLAAAIAKADRLGDTKAGRDYKGNFYSALGTPMEEAMAECGKTGDPASPAQFDLVFVLAADGRVLDLLCSAKPPLLPCVVAKLRAVQLPPPPKANWLVHVVMSAS